MTPKNRKRTGWTLLGTLIIGVIIMAFILLGKALGITILNCIVSVLVLIKFLKIVINLTYGDPWNTKF